MRIRSLASAALLAGGLIATATPATAAAVAPEQSAACSLTVTNLYYSIGMQTAFAKLSGGCSGPIDITLERAVTPTGPYQEEPDALYYLQQAADGTAATAYFMDPAERGYCRAKASFDGLVAHSPASVSC
ncbi:hypothetical protein ACIBJE_17695 [Micromonospora sp. NPDC050187]|uniref:hypothetical protein n=1 Tax=Micromonospora sp. NPDC050187 TaxID=3364277 RepID=UPI00378B6A76